MLRAVVAGLLRPVGQKFKVTAKGGNRDVRFVEWSLLKMLLGYLVLTIVAVISAFGWDRGWSFRKMSSIALFWSWYNILILTLTCFVCIEQPRKRKAERLKAETVSAFAGMRKSLTSNPRHFDERTADRGTSPHSKRTTGRATDWRHALPARVVRTMKADFAVRIHDTIEARKAMIRQVYSSRYNPSISEVQTNKLIKAVLVRAFR